MLPFRFYLITDRRNAQHDAVNWLPRLAAGGLRALQIREKELSPGAAFEYAKSLQDALPEGHAPFSFYVNDRADIALSLGLAGAHLREDSVPLEAQAPMLRRHLRFAVSTHSAEGVARAEAAGAEFVTFGPVYGTPSKAEYGAPVGVKALEQVAARAKVPVIALGGINAQRAKECIEAGAAGVAAISAIWNAEDPLAALEQFKLALGGL